MKITKSQLHKVIQEELQAELNEETRLPTNLVRFTRMVLDDAGDDKVLQKIQQIEDKLGINFKMELAVSILEEFGIEIDPETVRTAITKGMQQKKRGNVINRMKSLEGGQDTVGVPAGGSPPRSGGGAGAGLAQALQDIN